MEKVQKAPQGDPEGDTKAARDEEGGAFNLEQAQAKLSKTEDADGYGKVPEKKPYISHGMRSPQRIQERYATEYALACKKILQGAGCTAGTSEVSYGEIVRTVQRSLRFRNGDSK
jgi:hypothetical protein